MPKPTKPQPSRLADAYQTYPTADAAAVAALRGITNKQYETGGGILFNKAQNLYAATEPVGQGNDAHFSAAVAVPKGWQLHSTYHTHPSGPRSTLFSGDDINMAQQLKAPSYVLALDDNRIRMFDPASSKVSKDTSAGPFDGGTFAYGNTVDETHLPAAMVASTPTAPPSPPAAAAATPSSTSAPPVAGIPAATTSVAGSRITMGHLRGAASGGEVPAQCRPC